MEGYGRGRRILIASIVGQLLLGWIYADFAAGLFHWWEDRLGREEWPVLGRWLIAPQRRHHRDPLAFLEASFLDRCQASIAGAAIYAVLSAMIFGCSIALVTAAIGAGIANQVHAWAHAPSSAPRLVRILQETGFLQSPKMHAAHHRPPHTRNYCPLTNWLNPPLEALRFWERLERAIGRPGAPS